MIKQITSTLLLQRKADVSPAVPYGSEFRLFVVAVHGSVHDRRHLSIICIPEYYVVQTFAAYALSHPRFECLTLIHHVNNDLLNDN